MAVGENSRVLGLGNRRSDYGDEGRMDVDSGVEEEGVGGTEVVGPSGNAAGVGAGGRWEAPEWIRRSMPEGRMTREALGKAAA